MQGHLLVENLKQRQEGTICLHLLESFPSSSSVKLDDRVETHDLEERFRVHALR